MPFIPATGLVAKTALEFTYHGRPMVNTLWFEKTDESEWNGAELIVLNLRLTDWWEDNMASLLSVDLSLVRLYSTKQDFAESIYAEHNPIGLVGAVVGEGYPANVAVAVKFASNISGRSHRGRNFVGGLPPGAVDDSSIDNTFAANLVSAYSLLNDEVQEAIEAQHVVVSHFTDNAPREEAVTVAVAQYAVRSIAVNTMGKRVR